MPLILKRALVLTVGILALATATSQASSNGALGSHELAPAHTDQSNQTAYLSKDFAAAFNDARVCANRAGVSLTGNYSQYHPAATYYRSLRLQAELRRTLIPQGVLVAPYGASNHGWGRALDASPSTIRWFQLQGWRWHVFKTEAFVEPWHWNYTGGTWKYPDPGTSLRFPVLRRGSGGRCLGPAVKELQRRLGVDQSGTFGPGTERALRAYQGREFGAHSKTGVAGKTTWLHLRAERGVPHPNYVRITRPTRMAGQDVTAVIGLLNARRKEQRKPPVANDGVFNVSDGRALKNFQRSRRLDASGVAGPKTLKALRTPSAKTQKASLHRVAAAKAAGFEVKSVAKARRDYGCAKVESGLKRQTCKVRVLRGQWQRRVHYAHTLHGHQRGVWLTRAKHTRKSYNAAKATLYRLERPTAISKSGVQFVGSWEGLYHRCYNDGATSAGGYATIGYGHLLHYSLCTAHDRTLYLSDGQALALLAKDLAATDRSVLSALHVRVNQNEFDALVSFAFNVGTGGLRSSTLLRELNAGHKLAAANQFLVWDKAGGRVLLGLHRRRVAERALFLR